MTIPDPDDTALLDRARAGDREAQGILISRYAEDVYRLTARLLSDADLARDAAQDAFVNALNGIAGFRGQASVRTWILRIAANAATTLGRRRTRRREFPLDAAGDPADAGGGDDSAAARLDGARLERLLARLPEKQRMAVVLRVRNGLSYREVGEVIDCSEGSARVNYHLGIKRLRELAES